MMKNYFLGIMLLIVAASCKNNTDSKGTITGDAFPDIAIGTDYNGYYEVDDAVAIKKQWEDKLAKDKTFGSTKIDLQGFEIVKGQTEGDAKEDFYMLVARSTDGITKVAALLERKDDKKFYFVRQKSQDGNYVYFNIVCTGQCTEGCLPVVKLVDGKKYLICSDCVDCMKIENEINEKS